jgi:RNA polymerase subunit RPABC4/transcription elongation factor Spt4
MKCFKCGQLLKDSDRYCPHCGVALDEQERLGLIGEAVILSGLAKQAQTTIDDKELMGSLEIDVNDKNETQLQLEAIAFYLILSEMMFGAAPKMATVFQGAERKFISTMQANLPEIKNLSSWFESRKKQYFESRNEKRGPNEFWPATNYFLDNLSGRKTKNGIAMFMMTAYMSGLVKYYEAIIPEIK